MGRIEPLGIVLEAAGTVLNASAKYRPGLVIALLEALDEGTPGGADALLQRVRNAIDARLKRGAW